MNADGRGLGRWLAGWGGLLAVSVLVVAATAFVAPVVLGGQSANAPTVGEGWSIADAPRLEETRVMPVGDDVLMEGYWPAK